MNVGRLVHMEQVGHRKCNDAHHGRNNQQQGNQDFESYWKSYLIQHMQFLLPLTLPVDALGTIGHVVDGVKRLDDYNVNSQV